MIFTIRCFDLLKQRGGNMTALNFENLSFYERKFAPNIIRMYPSHTNQSIAKQIGTTSKTVSKIAKKLTLIKPRQADMQPDEQQFNILKETVGKKTCTAIARDMMLPRNVVARWIKEYFPHDDTKRKVLSSKDLLNHYYILCMWYLRGFSIRNIVVSYCGATSDEEIISALEYDDGKLFKTCYLKIKFAGNNVSINDFTPLGMKLKEKVRRWDDILDKRQVKSE